MEFNLTTPGLLFSAISLLLLAFTNRFLALASLARDLHDRHTERPSEDLAAQIDNLRKRLRIIRNTQLLGIISFFFCVLSMFCLFAKWTVPGMAMFGVSLLVLMASLVLSMTEIIISVRALDIQLGSDGATVRKKPRR